MLTTRRHALALTLLFLASLGGSRESLARAGATSAPDVRSQAVLVLDRSTGEVLYSRHANQARPIASITKLMTALVVLDGRQPLDEVITITEQDRARTHGNASRLAVGTKLTRRELLHLALMSSENRAAQALGRNYPGGEEAFVRTMNLKARALGMSQSQFTDPTGLSSRNVASPRDLAKLVAAANANPLVRSFSTSPGLTVKVGKQLMEFHNTNPLVRDPGWEVTVQKTGYISEAGQCLVMQARIDGRPIVMVLLNSFGKLTRVADARRIRRWMGAQPGGPLTAEVRARKPAG